jgi:phage-related protein
MGKGAINGIIGFFENAINAPFDILNGAIDIINKIPGVNVGKIARVKIPRLAEGTYTTSPLYAQLGEQGAEAVVPLEHNTQWAEKFIDVLEKKGGGMGGMTVNINVSGAFATSAQERRKVAQQIMDAFKQVEAARGAV